MPLDIPGMSEVLSTGPISSLRLNAPEVAFGEGSGDSTVSLADPSETTLAVCAIPSETESLEFIAEGIGRGDFVRLFNGAIESTPSAGGSEYNGIADN